MIRYWYLAFFIFLTACTAEAPTPVFHESDNPKALSEWGQLSAQNGQLKLADTAIAYDLNTPLFSDYAGKLRTVWMPDGMQASYKPDTVFDFPVGTVITKTFYYETGDIDNHVLKSTGPLDTTKADISLDGIKLIETRILARRNDGWAALPYVWNDDQTDATLKRIGDLKKLTLVDGDTQTPFPYVVPNANQCIGCHATNNTTRKIMPIGPKARHLNRNFDYDVGTANQIAYWQNTNRLSDVPDTHPKAAVWTDTSETLEARARAYLDVNCSHCHNKVGPADTSGLLLEPGTPIGPKLGRCKLPIAAGTGTGNRKYDIVPGDPDQSIFIYRMASTDPAVMMPEVGRALAHEDGVELIAQWIAEMDGSCDATPTAN